MSTESENDQFQTLVASSMLAGILMCTRQGMGANKAFRVVVVEYLQKEFGSKVWKEIGVPTRTAERWRREHRELLADAVIEDDLPPDVLEVFQRLQGDKK